MIKFKALRKVVTPVIFFRDTALEINIFLIHILTQINLEIFAEILNEIISYDFPCIQS